MLRGIVLLAFWAWKRPFEKTFIPMFFLKRIRKLRPAVYLTGQKKGPTGSSCFDFALESGTLRPTRIQVRRVLLPAVHVNVPGPFRGTTHYAVFLQFSLTFRTREGCLESLVRFYMGLYGVLSQIALCGEDTATA